MLWSVSTVMSRAERNVKTLPNTLLLKFLNSILKLEIVNIVCIERDLLYLYFKIVNF